MEKTDLAGVTAAQLRNMNLDGLRAMRAKVLKTDPANLSLRTQLNEEIRCKEGLAGDEADIAGFEQERRRKAAETAAAKDRLVNIDAAKAALKIASENSQKFSGHLVGLVATFTAAKKADAEARSYLRAAGVEVAPDDGMTWLLELALNNDLLGMKLPIRSIGYDKDRPTLSDVVAVECRTMADAISRAEQNASAKAAG